ncbi:keywimysin-related RiPP [Amycolatopsis sp. NPDC049868]
MKEYETPMLIEAGEFEEVTGLLAAHGNDRLIFSKN